MNRAIKWIAPVAAAVALAPAALAQGGFQMNPQMQAKFQAWQKWRQNHPHIQSLQQTMIGFREMEKDPKTKLTRDQARKILPVVKAWRNKPTMSDDQALQVTKQLTASLNTAQLKKIATAPQFGRGGRGFGGGARPGGGGPGGPGGGRPGGPGGGRGGFDPSKMPDPKDYNPLNPDTNPIAQALPQASQRMKQTMAEFIAGLQAAAK